jgi:ribosomal protein S12 methylthiotransferase
MSVLTAQQIETPPLDTGGEVLKYYMVSLGCPKNLVESEEMMAKLAISGMVLVNEPEEADLLVLNTCGFLNSSKEESIEAIIELAEVKDEHPWQKLVVVGCLVERYRKELQAEMPEVDAFVGVHDKDTFVELAWEAMGRRQTGFMPESMPYLPRLLTTPPHMAYLRISDGCFHKCSFCAIPKMRGTLVSRPMEEIEHEAKALAAGGAKELVVISQDTTSYGYDLYGNFALTELLDRLERIDGVEWIRLMYAYPHLVTKKLARYMERSEKIVPYIDMPIQHGDPEVLKWMNRSSNERHIRIAVDRLRSARADMVIRTTAIVGFPGEKQKHFDNMMNLLEELKFDHVGVFKFSREDGTPSAEMPGQVSERIKDKRLRQLNDWAAEKAFARHQRMVGSMMNVLLDQYDENANGFWGRHYGQAPDVDGQVFVMGEGLAEGEFVKVRISDADEENLIGYAHHELMDDLKMYIPNLPAES